MAVRNFWIEVDIDGRKTPLCGGPRRKDGGMDVSLYQRDEGNVELALHIRCFERNGKLTIVVYSGEEKVADIRSMR